MITQRQDNFDIRLEPKTFFKKINGLKFKTDNIIYIVDFEKIIYCQAENNYCHIYTTDKEYFISKTLKWVGEQLPPSLFIRVHSKYIVNTQFITSFNQGLCSLLISDVIKIQVSRRKVALIKRIIMNY